VRSQRQRHESDEIVDVDELVRDVFERNRALDRRRATDEKPNHDSGHRDRPEGRIQNQLRNRSRLALSREAVPQPCHEPLPVEPDVKADSGHHDQRGQPVEVQPGEASEAKRSRAKCSRANVELEEQKHSARERQERGDKQDDINKELELIARHALIIGTGARSRTVEPTNPVPFQTNRSPVHTGRKSVERRRGLSPSLTSGARKAGAPHALRSTIYAWHIRCLLWIGRFNPAALIPTMTVMT